jgi:hypothetical protein
MVLNGVCGWILAPARGYFRGIAMNRSVAQLRFGTLLASEARLRSIVARSASGVPRHVSRVVRAIAVLALVLLPLPGPAQPRVIRLAFRSVDSMILVVGGVNGKPATLLLDTGANNTIVSAKMYGAVQFQLSRAHHNPSGPGMIGDSLRAPVDFTLANHLWVGQRVAVMDLDDLKKILGINFDGILGQDILRQFRSIRIDYHAHTIELEE